MVSINRFKAEQMVDVFKTIITMRSQKPGLVANAVSKFSIICDGLNLPIPILVIVVIGTVQIHS